MNNKGLMQIKLLAIIFIVGIICFTIIPKSISYYNNRKKDNYIRIAKECIDEVKDSIDTLEYKQMPLKNEALVVKLSNLGIKAKSPYGNFLDEYSYIIVVNIGEYYDYYIAAIDSSNHGIPIVSEKELNIDSIVYGRSQLTNINEFTSIDNLYIYDTLFEKSDSSKEEDVNIILTPISGELSVPYDFKADVHKIYDKLVKNIDTDIYNREATINNGVLKYNNKVIASNYAKDINGIFRYLSFPNGNSETYYASFVNYNKSYAAGVINESSDYSSSAMTFDSIPAIVMNKDAKVVIDQNKKYLMWNMMAIYPDNKNYTISECGALILKDNNATDVKITFDTRGVLVGKSNNNCELGNIFAIRKANINTNDRYFARGYIKYKDKSGREHISYSKATISALVK